MNLAPRYFEQFMYPCSKYSIAQRHDTVICTFTLPSARYLTYVQTFCGRRLLKLVCRIAWIERRFVEVEVELGCERLWNETSYSGALGEESWKSIKENR